MSRASSIDVFQADRGLATCFEAANIETAWKEEFIQKHKILTLDDYVYLVTHSSWEQSLTDLVDACPNLKHNRVILSRFKAAWESGSNAVKQASQPVGKGGPDQMDEMLLSPRCHVTFAPVTAWSWTQRWSHRTYLDPECTESSVKEP